jgi:hypothetical protein
MRYDQAIRRLVPNAEYTIQGDIIEWRFDQDTNEWVSDNFVWLLKNVPKPTKDEIEQSLLVANNEWRASQYRRLRQPEYPSIGDQLDALWKGGAEAEAMLARIQAVKNKYPKE